MEPLCKMARMAYEELAAHSAELLAPMGSVKLRRMFGGHGIYVDDLFIALIAFDRLFLKTDDETRAQFEGAGGEPFIYEAAGKPVTVSAYWTVPAEAMESPALMQPWARLAIAAALRARASKPSSTRRKPKATEAAPAAKPRKAKAAAPRGKASARGSRG
jgi:DNA transformation protein and related proteins